MYNLSNKNATHTQHSVSDNIANLSGQTLPSSVKEILNYSPNSAIHDPKQFPVVDIIKCLEYAISCSDLGDVANITRAKCTNILMNFKHGFSNNCRRFAGTPGSIRIYNAFRFTKAFLRNNPDLVVTRSDKGNKTVVMTKNDYNTKLRTIIDDELVYRPTKRNITTKLENEANKMLTDLFTVDGSIEKLNKFISRNSNPPRIYGLPKIHKAQYPLRPIVSFIGSPLYGISKLLANTITASLPNSQFAVKNSYHMVERVRGLILPDNYILVSLDVTSLFTNITLSLIEKAFKDTELSIPSSFPHGVEQLMDMIRFCMESTYFAYEGKFYGQIQGCPMGSPVSPILAHVCMEFLIKRALSQLQFKPPFIVVFVDDILMSIPSYQVEHTMNIFNSLDTHIKFTYELETDGAIPYLDTIVSRISGKITTK